MKNLDPTALMNRIALSREVERMIAESTKKFAKDGDLSKEMDRIIADSYKKITKNLAGEKSKSTLDFVRGEEFIRGDDGKDGAKGKDGQQGGKGADGYTGVDGKDGKAGQKGDKGESGLSGMHGLSGKDGKDGIDGRDGKEGVSIVNADLAADGNLVFTLSNGNELDIELPSMGGDNNATYNTTSAALEPVKSVVALADEDKTLTAAQIVDKGIFTIIPTAARTLTTDTATNIVNSIPRYQVGTWFDFTIFNLAAFNVTLAAGTGVTLVGATIIVKESGTWIARVDSATTITICNNTTVGVQGITTNKLADAVVTYAQVKIKETVALADENKTLTAAQLVDKGIFTITPTQDRTLTTDTAENIVAALPRYQVGTCFDFTVVNNKAFNVVLAGGTGVTIAGKNSINAASGTWKVRVDSSTAVTMYITTGGGSSTPPIAQILSAYYYGGL